MDEIKDYNGYYFSINTNYDNLGAGIIRVSYDVQLNHLQGLNDSILTLWLHNVKINDQTITDLQFISDVKQNTRNTGSFEINYSDGLRDDFVVYSITYEIALDKMDVTVDKSDFKLLVTPYLQSEDGIYNHFLKLNHNKKSHNNLCDLAKIIADAYRVSPSLANKMWNDLWFENRSLKGLQKRYFILVIFENLSRFLGTNDSVELLLMEKYRFNHILEKDGYGIKNVIKKICTYYITNSEYEYMIDALNLYQEINDINDIIPVNNEDLCVIVYGLINPKDNNYGQASQETPANDIEEINISQVEDFCEYLKCHHNSSTMHCLIATYLSCVQKRAIFDSDLIEKCLQAIVKFSFRNTIDLLMIHEEYLSECDINKTLRNAISKNDLFFRHGFDILEERKAWFEAKLVDETVFMGFFEKRKCMLSDFEIDFLINLMLDGRWEKLQECFELVVENGDVCRVGSLISFVSNSVQSYKRKYTHSTLDVGLFKVEMECSAFCGIEYIEIATIDRQNMLKYMDVLKLLCLKLQNDLRDEKNLEEAIQELEEKLKR